MGDGEFWIDPDASGNPLKVYCDMTTDEGKKNKSCGKEQTNLCCATRISVCHWVAVTITRAMKTRGHLDEIDINIPPPPPLGHTPGI